MAMKRDIALVLYYTRENKFSHNALVGALETDEYFNNLPLYLLETEKELVRELENASGRRGITVVGISMCTNQVPVIKKLLDALKKKFKTGFIYIAGGPHPTGEPEATLKMGFDLAVTGEGEETLAEILKKIDKNEDYRGLKGCACFDDNGKYRFTGKRRPLDINNYPAQAAKNKIFGSIELTRGCPFFCKFCQTSYIFGGKMRHRSIENICRYLNEMKENNLRDIRFITPSAFSYGSADGRKINLGALEKLFSSIRKTLGTGNRVFIGSFPSETRPEQVTKETLKLVLDYASNDNIIIGAQAGSQRMLDLCRRGHTVRDIYNAAALTLDAGLKANVDFIFGLPGETKEDRKASEKVTRDLTRMGAVIRPHKFMPLPQTPFYK